MPVGINLRAVQVVLLTNLQWIAEHKASAGDDSQLVVLTAVAAAVPNLNDVSVTVVGGLKLKPTTQ